MLGVNFPLLQVGFSCIQQEAGSVLRPVPAPPTTYTHTVTHTEEVMLHKNLLTLQSRLFQEHSYMQDH